MTCTYLQCGSGEPLVFLHGIGGGAMSFVDQLGHFGAAYRAIAWDMPGYGGSPLLAETTFPALAAAFREFLDQIGVERAHLVGHSIGGMIAQEFVATWPGRVASLVLSGTSPAFGKADGEWQQQFVAARIAPLERGLTMAENARSVVPELVGEGTPRAALDLATACMARVPAETYKATMRCLVTFDRRDALGRIAVPTLLLAGEKDSNAPAPMMEKMAGKISGARYVCLERVGHLANLEDPAAFNEAVENFLRG